MFEKTLSDIVKGIRASKRDTALYISQCIAEIKQEINSTDLYVKANALNKLTFLQMMGYGMSWASFASIEVMSSPRFAHKRIGYLAACQGFNQNTDVILLTTNLLQKELRGALGGTGMYEAGLAINCISNIVTEDLARDVLPEVTNLTKHPQPYLRKKAILCLFKMFMKYPQGLRLTFDNIQHCLEDSDPSVVSCAVNVVTELSDKNPKNYLHLAPAFFQLLTQSQNNWMLIKVVKLLGSLVPEEPRLARKLLEPLAGIVNSTHAKSLLYEAVYTITLCMPYCRKADGSMPANAPKILQLCASTLRDFCADKDQNLKYLGLVGFSSLRQSYPKCLVESDARPLILACLSDEDVTIRTRALDLLPGMTSRKNLQELVAQLLRHVEAASGQYKKDIVLKILELCSSDKYALLQDFSWYLDILLKLSYVSPEDLGSLLEKQITDVALRVLPVRTYAVQECTKVLIQKTEVMVLPQVLPAAAWIVGEYSDLLNGDYHNLVRALSHSSNVGQMPSSTQAVYIQAALKVFAAATNSQARDEEVVQCVETLSRNLPVYMQSLDVEIQERACTGLQLLRALDLVPSALDGPPRITISDDDDDDDNLLGMMGGSKTVKQHPTSSSLASRCREAASTLSYLLKPEPMKPISAKIQRKKRQAPLGGIDTDWLDAPADMSAFSFLNDMLDAATPTLEQVSFTQQRPFQPAAPKSVPATPIPMDVSGFGSADSAGKTSLPQTLPDVSGESSGLNNPRHPQDPFYLDAGGAQGEAMADVAGRFGTIQLLDSDEEEDDAARKKRKKKEKRKKKLVALETTAAAAAPVTVFDSDDDDDDDQLLPMGKPRKGNVGNDFAGLASVDLTTPLGEHEVMPAREHRQVPARAPEQVDKGAKKKKKKKESKKKSKQPDANSPAPIMGGVGDLLDLGGFSSVADVSNPAVQGLLGPRIVEAQTTPISSAFDDLLGLEVPPPVAPLASTVSAFNPSVSTPASPPSQKKGKRAWMKASLKVAGSGGPPMVDWSHVSVYYKVVPQSQGIGGVSASINVRVQNDMATAPLNFLTLTFKNHGNFSLGTVATKDTEETKKLGPFTYQQMDSSMDLKGSLSTSDNCQIPIKITLPAALHLAPTVGLTLDNVMEELSNEPFTSCTAKVTISNLDSASVKLYLTSFFCAAEVGDSGPTMGTVAAQSHQGAKVRVLIKIKDSAVKVDIKSTSASLCKMLAADVKKLML